jgi:hypothetical protein
LRPPDAQPEDAGQIAAEDDDGHNDGGQSDEQDHRVAT